MYKRENSKTKLFTKLTNQSSCVEARAIGGLLKTEKWNRIPSPTLVRYSSCSIDHRTLSLLLLMWSMRISWTSLKVCLG